MSNNLLVLEEWGCLMFKYTVCPYKCMKTIKWWHLFGLRHYNSYSRLDKVSLLIHFKTYQTFFFSSGIWKQKLRKKTRRESCWATKAAWRSHTVYDVSSLSSSWSTPSASVWTVSSTSASPAHATTRRSTAGYAIPVTWPGRSWQSQRTETFLSQVNAWKSSIFNTMSALIQLCCHVNTAGVMMT